MAETQWCRIFQVGPPCDSPCSDCRKTARQVGWLLPSGTVVTTSEHDDVYAAEGLRPVFVTEATERDSAPPRDTDRDAANSVYSGSTNARAES